MRLMFLSAIILVFSVSCTGKNIKKDPVKVTEKNPVKIEEKNNHTGKVENNPLEKKVKEVTEEEKVKFAEYLVNPKYYSTNGGYYQSKYKARILSIIKGLIEKHSVQISEGTFGFYFDKKSKRTDSLFLGLDINVDNDKNMEYAHFAVSVIKKNAINILNEIYTHRVILKENEIVGVVIGFKWKQSGIRQQVNIWIKESDINLTYTGKITVNEMLQRSTITNTEGKVILLSI